MEIGIDSFAARFGDDNSGTPENNKFALAQLLERMEFADKTGHDIFLRFRIATNINTRI
jgi:hypothetical protein